MNPWTLALSNLKPIEHSHTCKNCGKGFSDAKPAQTHCSYECQRAWSNKSKVRRCKVCNKWCGSSYCDEHRPADWEAQKAERRKGKPKERGCKRRTENAAAAHAEMMRA